MTAPAVIAASESDFARLLSRAAKGIEYEAERTPNVPERLRLRALAQTISAEARIQRQKSR